MSALCRGIRAAVVAISAVAMAGGLVAIDAAIDATPAGAATSTPITLTDSVGDPDRGETANARDGNLATDTYATPSNNTVSPATLSFGFASALVNRIRLYKDNEYGAHNLTIQYTTGTDSDLNARTWQNVTRLSNGYFGTELLTATAISSNGTVTADAHVSTGGGAFASLMFDTVLATGVRISFDSANVNNHYHVFEFEAHNVDATLLSFTDGSQTYTVPPGVDSITVDACGAEGGGGQTPVGNRGAALGGRAVADIAVTPGEELTVLVGGAGTGGSGATGELGGFNGGGRGGTGNNSGGGGGGGGGSSTVLRGTTPLVVAAGGGGGAGVSFTGGQVNAGSQGEAGETGGFGSGGVGGGAGTATDPGAGGFGSFGGDDGAGGTGDTGGVGGDGAGNGGGGGGGGGGLFGGGGGGGGGNIDNTGMGGAGGGGSGLAPGGTLTSDVNCASSREGTVAITINDTPSIKIVKNAVPDDDQDFTFNTTSSGSPILSTFDLDDDGDDGFGSTPSSQIFDNLAAGEYTITEDTVSGWSLTDLACTGGGTTDEPNRKVTVNIAAYEDVVCTFTNTANPGSITIVKDSVPNDAQDFGYTTTGGLSPSTFTLDDDGGTNATHSNSRTFTGLAPGIYSVTETAITGWDESASCTTGGTVLDTTATIVLTPDAAVTCTFTNAKLGSLTIVKDSVPNDGQDFGYTTTGGLSPSTFTLDDDAGADGTFTNQRVYNDLAVGTYSVTETGGVAGWDLADLTCTTGGSDSGSTATVTITGASEDVTCTYTNHKRGSIKVVKNAIPDNPRDFFFSTTGAGLSDFSLDDDTGSPLSNEKQFTNLVPGSYSVTEAAPGNGWTLTGLSCPSETVSLPMRKATISLSPGQALTCTFTNSRRQPDAMIKNNAEAASAYAKDDFFTPFLTPTQTKSQNVKRNATATYQVLIENDGALDSFRVHGSADSPGTTVTYFRGATNVTSAMRSAAGYSLNNLATDASVVITVKIQAAANASIGSSKTINVYAVSKSDVSRRDAVTAKATIIL